MPAVARRRVAAPSGVVWSSASGTPGPRPGDPGPIEGVDVQLTSSPRRALGLLAAGTIGLSTALLGVAGVAQAATRRPARPTDRRSRSARPTAPSSSSFEESTADDGSYPLGRDLGVLTLDGDGLRPWLRMQHRQRLDGRARDRRTCRRRGVHVGRGVGADQRGRPDLVVRSAAPRARRQRHVPATPGQAGRRPVGLTVTPDRGKVDRGWSAPTAPALRGATARRRHRPGERLGRPALRDDRHRLHLHR